MGVSKTSKRNPWSVAECYFAVWGYDKIDSEDYDTKTGLAQAIAHLIGRTPKAVEYKFQNIAHFDPRDYSDKPFSPKHNAQKLLGEIFSWYWNQKTFARRQYSHFLALLKAGYDEKDFPKRIENVKKIADNYLVEEGEVRETNILYRKRSAKLVKEGRRYFKSLNPDGKIKCAVCGFMKPDLVNREIIHLHHTVPLKEYDERGSEIDINKAVVCI